MVNNVIKSKNKPHAILLVESKLCDLNSFIKKYIKSIVCTGDDCEWCKKIDNDSYFDIIRVDGYAGTIKKEEILNISNRFSSSSVESRGVKFYVIKGVEYATQQAINSLLKFLEEPPTDTYAILTTRAINLVLPTIKSRCQMFTFKSNFQVFDEILNKYNLDVHQKDVIKKTYYSYDDIINQLDSKVFYTIYDFANTFVHNLDNLPTIKALQEQFTKFDYKQIELVLRMLNALVSNNEKLFKLVDNVRVNPIKMLLFNNIWTILQGDK
ncbi:MAG: hypothetical protein LBS76_01865 [Mycoplasmataceae bacterium]|nr:hypothetical protein [Mycoplasmataceae bacterium]